MCHYINISLFFPQMLHNSPRKTKMISLVINSSNAQIKVQVSLYSTLLLVFIYRQQSPLSYIPLPGV